ncbi:MAG: hypothetical protein LWX56_02995 [Ignavibacteria bacterium]|nr:hypothetical protein [Ignavibacteria bacterium]
MKIASIDIGTNTLLMYIAEANISEKSITTIGNYYKIPRIGKGVAQFGSISKEKTATLIEILNEYAVIANNSNCELILANGTYPFRTAANAHEIIDYAAKETGITINILPPENEAFFSFLGATYNQPVNKSIAVIDIGGGSTEISVGVKGNLAYKKSIPIGAVNLTEKYLSTNPTDIANYSSLIQKINDDLYNGFMISDQIESVLAIAGTPTTLAAIKNHLTDFDENCIDGSFLTQTELDTFLTEMQPLSGAQMLEKYGSILKGREDVLLTGTAILRQILALLQTDKVQVSARGLRHGALYHYLFTTFGTYFSE